MSRIQSWMSSPSQGDRRLAQGSSSSGFAVSHDQYGNIYKSRITPSYPSFQSLVEVENNSPFGQFSGKPVVSSPVHFCLPPPNLKQLSPEELKVYERVFPVVYAAVKGETADPQVLDSVISVFFSQLKVEDSVKEAKQSGALSMHTSCSPSSGGSEQAVNPLDIPNWRVKQTTEHQRDLVPFNEFLVDASGPPVVKGLTHGKKSGGHINLFYGLNNNDIWGSNTLEEDVILMCRLCFAFDHLEQDCPLNRAPPNSSSKCQ